MSLNPRDAIHEEELDRYDAFMSNTADDHFLNMYMSNGKVTIDVHHYPSNDMVNTASFAPSPSADLYFEQEQRVAAQMEMETENQPLSNANQERGEKSTRKELAFPEGEAIPDIDKRRSR